jgi:hypothetical protein
VLWRWLPLFITIEGPALSGAIEVRIPAKSDLRSGVKPFTIPG